MRCIPFTVAAAALLCLPVRAQQTPAPPPVAPNGTTTAEPWEKLPTDPYRGKQDDVFFHDPQTGWYVNGAGNIYRTDDGGKTWVKKLSKPGTYFRCIGFADSQHGWAGNIGTDYFPGVTDETPLYQTRDGGETWQAVALPGPAVKGLCAIDVLRHPYIHAGKLEYKTVVHLGGRVGGPVSLLRSLDGGATWTHLDLSRHCAMILDVKFFTPDEGIVCAASSANVPESRALILTTSDGGKTWQKRYEGQRPWELTWKASFPTRKVGIVTIQNYNPDKAVSQRYIAKTLDGGMTWRELPLVNDWTARPFGVGFRDTLTGWVGSTQTGYETRDGGKTWTPVSLGQAANKIRLVPTPDGGAVAYAIGVGVYKKTLAPAAKPTLKRSQ